MQKKMETTIMGYMGGCQNDGPFLGTLIIRCRIITGKQKETIIVTTTHIDLNTIVLTISTTTRGPQI